MGIEQSILELAHDYFELLNDGNVETAKRLFHKECGLFHVNDGALAHMSLPKYLEMLLTRQSPKSRGEPVFGKVVSVEQTDENTAVLRVLSAVQPRYFEDFLSLLREDGQWKIVAKVYRVVPNGK